MDLAVCGMKCSFCKFYKEGNCSGCRINSDKLGCPILNCNRKRGTKRCIDCGDFLCKTMCESVGYCIRRVRLNQMKSSPIPMTLFPSANRKV